MAKILLGKVISTKMQGTVVVEVTRRTPHPLYKKLLKRSKHFNVDPNGQELSVGQKVQITETKPQAKKKYFKVTEVKKNMIQLRSILKPADNSGAKELTVIHVFGGSKRKFGRIGDIVNAVVKTAFPNGQVNDGEIVKAIIVCARKEFRRKDGSYIRFSDNAAVIIDNAKDKNPKGTRIFGPIAREIKEKGFDKIASMAVEVL